MPDFSAPPPRNFPHDIVSICYESPAHEFTFQMDANFVYFKSSSKWKPLAQIILGMRETKNPHAEAIKHMNLARQNRKLEGLVYVNHQLKRCVYNTFTH